METTEALEDSLDTYNQEWEQFTAEDASGQPRLEFLDLMRWGIVDYARAPILYLPYPIVVEMLRRFENNSFWYQDKVVQVNEELIHHITGLPFFGDKIDLKEVGAKWAVRILTRRLVGLEASTYLSHQWAAVAAKLSEGTMYPWALWAADKFKEHCMASQMSGHNFPMPSLLTVICSVDRGRPNDIYSSVIMANALDDRRLVLVWPHLAWIERTILDFTLACTLGSTFRPKRQLVVDHPLISPMTQHHYWTINKEHFSNEPYSMAWSLPYLPRIPIPEVQRKEGTTGKEKKRKSITRESESLKRKHLQVSSKQGTSERERKRHKPKDLKG
eukprot:Gb_08116 [translate_table: standard]